MGAWKPQKSRITTVMSSIKLVAVKQSLARLTCFVLVKAALPQVARDDGITHQPVPLAYHLTFSAADVIHLAHADVAMAGHQQVCTHALAAA